MTRTKGSLLTRVGSAL